MEPSIVLAPGASESGLCSMLATLIRQTLDEDAIKKKVVGRMIGRIAIVAPDLDQSLTLLFEGGRVELYAGIVGIPDITVRANAEWIMKMSLIETTPRLHLPDPRGKVAREVFGASRAGEIEVHASPASVPLLLRFTHLMSVV
ncbi:MAG: SCP2 sterol-binding domain-containing protein [Myxococcales bacterium]|nr:SCP2 sterol-binding domain-containing protein [Myxococcales bacterium]